MKTTEGRLIQILCWAPVLNLAGRELLYPWNAYFASECLFLSSAYVYFTLAPRCTRQWGATLQAAALLGVSIAWKLFAGALLTGYPFSALTIYVNFLPISALSSSPPPSPLPTTNPRAPPPPPHRRRHHHRSLPNRRLPNGGRRP